MKRTFLFLVLIFLFFSCREEGPSEPTNSAPKIKSISASPSSVKVNETTRLTCVATDADGDNLTYSWSAEDGNFLNGTLGSSINWESPSEEGTYVIQVIVSDGKEIDKKEKTIVSDKNFGILSGIVWDKVTGEAISMVKITILDRVVYTDSNGHYKMPNFPHGTYSIIAEKENYVWFKGEVTFYNVDREFDIVMEYLLSDLSGVVRDNITGELLENVTVKINDKKCITNENGYYEFWGLEKGLYTIYVDGDVAWHFHFEEFIVLNDRSVLFNVNLESKSCKEEPTITYAGKIYHTVKIGDQCWLKENLNVGTMIDGGIDASDNGIIEKYCYNNDESNCDKYGGLYQWEEAMRYVANQEKYGICPEGWHMPKENEIKALKVVVGESSNALKVTDQGSEEGVGTNTSGFSALLVGSRSSYDNFYGLGNSTTFWSSREVLSAYGISMLLNLNTDDINFVNYYKDYGFSVRCLKD